MKKIIAAMLILTVCVTTAFAADFTPGEEIRIDENDPLVWGSQTLEHEISTTYYSIAGQSWQTGRDLVSSVTVDNEENVFVIKLKPDYQSTRDKTLEGTVKVRDKKNGRFLTMTINCTIGYEQGTIDIGSDGDIADLIVEDDTVYTVTAADKGYPYGTLMFQADIADVSVRVYDKEKLFLGYDRSPDREILLANSENDAIMEFLRFEGRPTFSGNATLSFYGFEKGHYVYEIKNGKLTNTGAKWDDDTDSYVIKTRTLGHYVVSDAPLRSANGNTDNSGGNNNSNNDSNPETGANDVAGVAMALAVVSIVSAAAISLKKDKE